MKAIIEFIAVFSIGILNNLIAVLFYTQRKDYIKSFTPTENMLRYWVGALAGIFVVALVVMNQPEGLASIGISREMDNSSAIFLGLLTVALLIIFIGIVQRLILQFRKIPVPAPPDLTNPAVVHLLQYQSRLERAAYLTVLSLTVIAEDFVYRGYLVWFMGNRTHTFLPWIVLSLALSVIVHLYQGREISKMLFQALFAGTFIGLLLITKNLLAPLAGHLYYDIVWTTQIWRRGKAMEITATTPSGANRNLTYAGLIGLNLLVFYLLIQLTVWLG